MIFAEIVYILPNGYKEKNSKNGDEIKGEMNGFNEDVKKYSNQYRGFIHNPTPSKLYKPINIGMQMTTEELFEYLSRRSGCIEIDY